MPAPAGSKGLLKPAKISVEESEEITISRALWSGNLSPEDAEVRLQGYQVETLSVETNSRCPLRCSYCYLNERPETDPVSLSTLSAFLLDAIRIGTRRIAFVGKEPFYDDRAMQLMSMLDAHPLRDAFQMGVVTNGLMVNRFLDGLADLRLDYLDVSVDARASLNNQFRGKNAYEAAARAIRSLSNLPNIVLIVASVLHRFSLDQLEPFVVEMRALGARNFHFGPVLDLAPAGLPSGLELRVGDLVHPVMDQLIPAARGLAHGQIVVELPVEYSWQAISSGVFGFDDLRSDANGFLYWQPDADAPFFYKVYLLPQDCWRWARITADGFYLGSLRQAAKPDYSTSAAGHIAVENFEALWARSFAKSGWFAQEWHRAIQCVEVPEFATVRNA